MQECGLSVFRVSERDYRPLWVKEAYMLAGRPAIAATGTHTIRDHTMLPATRQRWPLTQPKLVGYSI